MTETGGGNRIRISPNEILESAGEVIKAVVATQDSKAKEFELRVLKSAGTAIDAAVITQDTGKAKSFDLVVLTDKDKAGLRLAHWTGLIGAALIAIIIANFIASVAALPKAPLLDSDLVVAPKTLAEADALLSYYKSVSDLTSDRTTKIFDLIITKTLLPIFTLILGFVFGSKVEQRSATAIDQSQRSNAEG